MYYTIAFIIFFATFAMMVREGLWNNLINTAAIVIGGLTAFGLHQPIVVYLDEQTDGSYTYLWDLLVLWGVFAVTVGVLKGLAQMLSKTRVMYHEKADMPAGAFFGALCGWLMCCFAMATLHTAPLTRDSFSGGFVYGDTFDQVKSKVSQTSALTKPDLTWLKLTESMMSPQVLGGDGFSASVYIHQHAQHRKTFESIKETLVKRK